MTMADPSYWRATFYIHQQTFNLTTPLSLTCILAHNSFTKKRHKIYAFTLPTLLCFLQVQTSGSSTSPFQVHPLTIKACMCGILGYYMSFRAWLFLPAYATQLSIAMKAFGSFSLASLVSILFSDSWWHFKCMFYVLLVVLELHETMMVTMLLHEKYYVKRLTLLWRSWSRNSVQQGLPLTHMDLIDYNV
ncbi:unnamed protein product [Sphenostylis stenocarpa]|uniref:Uncharacterized protein n=1 Tax=Sphenostylis stenocarpa TaxID=92480 RepID=A0AA86RM46_9FABA|nr:unnamed protein product [Sphenostylis stenocarpa]